MTPVSTRPTGTVPIPPISIDASVQEAKVQRPKGKFFQKLTVDILEGKSERLVGRSLRRVDSVNGVEEGDTLGGSGLGLLGPSLVPRHVGGSLTSAPLEPSN
jgi:hypothetical protein